MQVKLSNAKFDIFVKLLKDIVTSNDPVVINKSQIIKKIGNETLVRADVSEIFEDTNIDFHIVSPQKYLRIFKQMVNNNSDIIIEYDENTSRYVMFNGEIKLFLPRVDMLVEEQMDFPDISSAKVVDTVTIDDATRNVILNVLKDSDSIDLLFKDGALKGILVPETALIILPQYQGDPTVKNLDETNADLILKTTSFLPIGSSSTYTIKILQEGDGSYSMFVEQDLSVVKIQLYDKLIDGNSSMLLI